MNGSKKVSFEFGDYRLIPDEQMLSKNGVPVQLPNKAFEILVVLVENAGELVGKQQLLELVWKDSFVEEANIQVHISAIRKALNDKDNGKFVETVPKRGYRFTADVKVSENGTAFEKPTALLTDPEASTHGRQRDRRVAKHSTRPSNLFLGLAVFAVLAVAVALIFFWVGKQRAALANFSERMKLEKLTSSGSAFGAAISADGKYAAYQAVNAGRFSLWLMELATKTTVQITQPSETQYSGITFSPTDDSIYYLAADNRLNSVSTMYQMSRLGGEPKKLLTGIDSPPGFSADGKRFAFIRQNREQGETALMSANSDGTGEQTIAVRKKPDSFSTGKRPAWSPDGKTIACIGINSDESLLRVYTVNVSGGEVKPLTSEKWFALGDVIFLPDSDTLLLTAQDDRNFGPQQIWRTCLSGGGAAEKVTKERVNYVGLSLAADAGSLVSTESKTFNNLWVIPNGDSTQARQINPNTGAGRVDMSWTHDNRVVYTSNASGNPNIFIMNADGTNQTQITSDTFTKRSPMVSPDGRYIIFVSNQGGTDTIWRMDFDGQNQRQLTFDWIYRNPQFSPDGKWIIYSLWKDKQAFLWKVSIDGGEPVMLRDGMPFTPNVSPDMRSIAYLEKDEASGATKINIVPLAGGEIIRSFDVPQNTFPDAIRWTPDSRAVIYRCTRNSAMNFWLQPMNEAEPRQLTDLKYDPPLYCEWSRDAKSLSCVRATLIRDVVLFSELQ